MNNEKQIRQHLTAAQNHINQVKDLGGSVESISDGYHSFDILYDFRMLLQANLFNLWANIDATCYEHGIIEGRAVTPLYSPHKSLRHHDGELCFGGNEDGSPSYFIVVALLPDGQISNHYKIEHWSKFKIPAHDKALFPFDGHDDKDALARLENLL